MEQSRAVVLLSGGLDSATVLAIARTEGFVPLQFTLGRLAFGALALLVILAIKRERLPRPRRIWGHLTVAARGVPGDVYVYGQGENISMRDWTDLILRTGEEHGFWSGDRHVVINEKRMRNSLVHAATAACGLGGPRADTIC